MKYKRIAIIGNAGSGKSTLSKKLQKITNLPVYHLDKYYWQPNWIESNPEEYKKIHDELCNQLEWIIDGMNLRLLQYRMEKADIIVFLDEPRIKCLYRVFKRTILNYGKSIQVDGCIEKFNFKYLKFLKWVWNFKKNYKPKILELIDLYNKKTIYIISSENDLNNLLEEFL